MLNQVCDIEDHKTLWLSNIYKCEFCLVKSSRWKSGFADAATCSTRTNGVQDSPFPGTRNRDFTPAAKAGVGLDLDDDLLAVARFFPCRFQIGPRGVDQPRGNYAYL